MTEPNVSPHSQSAKRFSPGRTALRRAVYPALGAALIASLYLDPRCQELYYRWRYDSYGYVFKETTGMTSHIVINGKEVPISFSKDSAPLALRSLRALKWKVLYANSAGRTIFIIGEYSAAPRMTPPGPGYAQPEEYHEFKLVRWYIVTPFEGFFWWYGSGPPVDMPLRRTKNHLGLEDFRDFVGKDKFDVRRFQRREAK